MDLSTAEPPAKAYGEFIDSLAEWQLFCTFTFHDRKPPECVERHCHDWAFRFCCEQAWRQQRHNARCRVHCKVQNRTIDPDAPEGLSWRSWLRPLEHWSGPFVDDYRSGRRGLRPRYLIGIEPNQRGGHHAHMLFRNPSILGRPSLRRAEAAWKDRHGTHCKVEHPRSGQATSVYSAKYIAKGGELAIV